MDTLIAHGADASKVHLAELCYNTGLVYELLKRGADPKTMNLPWFLDLAADNLPMLDSALKYQVDYTTLDADRFLDFSNETESTLKVMLKNGYNPNIQTDDGTYLIETAIRKDLYEIVIMLLEGGATKAKGYKDPYEYALKVHPENSRILNLLKKRFTR